jgi:hypothetical protein
MIDGGLGAALRVCAALSVPCGLAWVGGLMLILISHEEGMR